jgi:TRAP transporter TAXI family solute receptor
MFSFRAVIGVAALLCAATTANAQVVGVATNPQGTLYYSAGSAVAGVLQQKGGMTARVQPMSGSSAYAPLLNRGEVEFGLMNAIDVGNAFEGILNFKGRKNPELRLVGVLFPITVGMAVPNDSPAKSIKDLKGYRVPSQFTSQSTIVFVQDALLATGGLSIADMKPFPVPDYSKGMLALGDGKVDAAMFGLGTGASQETHVALSSRGGLRYLSTSDTPDSAAAMRKVFSATYTKVFNPAPGYPGIVAPTRLMLYPAFLVTSTHVSSDVVYKATKAVYENKATLEAASAILKAFDPKDMAQANAVPYHPGAERFYKEAKEWPPKKP